MNKLEIQQALDKLKSLTYFEIMQNHQGFINNAFAKLGSTGVKEILFDIHNKFLDEYELLKLKSRKLEDNRKELHDKLEEFKNISVIELIGKFEADPNNWEYDTIEDYYHCQIDNMEKEIAEANKYLGA